MCQTNDEADLALANTTSDYGKHYILTLSIDLSDEVFDSALIAGGEGDPDDYEGYNKCGFLKLRVEKDF